MSRALHTDNLITDYGQPNYRLNYRLTGQIEAVLAAINVLAFESPCDLTSGRLRAPLEKSGQLVGGNDLLIAAQALTLGYTIVTDNDREFSRINQLRLENWLRPS